MTTPYNEAATRRRMQEEGYEPHEIEDALDAQASDAYDTQRDYDMEDEQKERDK